MGTDLFRDFRQTCTLMRNDKRNVRKFIYGSACVEALDAPWARTNGEIKCHIPSKTERYADLCFTRQPSGSQEVILVMSLVGIPGAARHPNAACALRRMSESRSIWKSPCDPIAADLKVETMQDPA
jgi:hypothetical protein